MKKSVVLILIVSLLFSNIPAFAGDGFVYFTVEKLTLGGGFIEEPVKIPFSEGESLAHAILNYLGEENLKTTGTADDNLYISAVSDSDELGEVPSEVLAIGGKAQSELSGKADADFLSEFDYSYQAGWCIIYNNEKTPLSLSQISPQNGDVLRLCFTLFGYGEDIMLGADKDGLIRLIADKTEAGEAVLPGEYDALFKLLVTEGEISALLPDLPQSGSENGYVADDSAFVPEEKEDFKDKVDEIIKAEETRLLQYPPKTETGGGEWSVFALARCGALSEEYKNAYLNEISGALESSGGVLSKNKYTEYARSALTLIALGEDIRYFGGYNLVDYLKDEKMVLRQGINGAIFALLALSTGDFDAEKQRESYLSYILENECRGGGFSLSGDKPDTDITSMALCALAPFERAKDAVERGISVLSRLQQENGAFKSYEQDNIESTAQAIIALSTLGINPCEDSRFIKNNQSAVEYIINNYEKGFGFPHISGEKENPIASEQALLSLCAYKNFLEGKSPVYKMKAVETDYPFNDIYNHFAKDEITEFYNKGIVSGAGEKSFMPNAPVTRAAFAKILCLALGLKGGDDYLIPDVSKTDWSYPYVCAVIKNKIAEGGENGTFMPNKNITRQEASKFIASAAEVMGIKTGIDKVSAQNVLMQYFDFSDCAGWSVSPLAFCITKGIIKGSEGNILPLNNLTRGEAVIIISRLMSLEE